MPWHVALDGARERRLGRLQIGTTRRGIGPAYADKATRIGIRVQDLLDSKILGRSSSWRSPRRTSGSSACTTSSRSTSRDVVSTQLGFAERLAPYVADTSLLVDRTLRAGERVLFEGAQGTLLDLDHGTYPFVTSSSPIAAGAAVSFGIGPNRIEEVLGVAKAYVTRVGEGPFPSEIVGPEHERVQTLGHEFGTVTGRERRCGWLDLVALRFAVRVNGVTSLALTKLDVLSSFPELPVCVRYRLPTGRRPRISRRTRATSTTAARCSRCSKAGRRRSRTSFPAPHGRTSGSSPTLLGSRSRSSEPARRASTCSRSADGASIAPLGRWSSPWKPPLSADGSYGSKGALRCR
jgi:adenylosuccinate synthase